MSGTNSGERILAVLDAFSEERLEWTIEELIAETGYSRPTLYRYLKSLREVGLLTSLPNAGFTLGPRVVEMDFLMRKSDKLVSHGQQHLEALTTRYPCSALLVRWYGQKLLCVSSKCSISNPLSSYPRGRPMPLPRGAISRAIMAYLPRRRLVPLIETHIDELGDIGLGRDVKEVLESMRQVRRAGVAVAHGEVTPGVFGVASPVFDAGHSPIAAICVTIGDQEATPDRLEAIRHDILQHTATLSAALDSIRFQETSAAPQQQFS